MFNGAPESTSEESLQYETITPGILIEQVDIAFGGIPELPVQEECLPAFSSFALNVLYLLKIPLSLVLVLGMWHTDLHVCNKICTSCCQTH